MMPGPIKCLVWTGLFLLGPGILRAGGMPDSTSAACIVSDSAKGGSARALFIGGVNLSHLPDSGSRFAGSMKTVSAVPVRSEWSLGIAAPRRNAAFYAFASALAAGIVTAYAKDRANYYDDRYHAEGRGQDRGLRDRYDVTAGVSLVVAEISFTILSYVLLVDK